MRTKFLALFLLPLLSFTVLEWQRVTIDERATIEFPSAPEEKEMSGNQVWVADDSPDGRCMAMLLDFEKFGMDSASLEQEFGKPETFDQFKSGILGQIEGSKVISESNTRTNGYRTFIYKIDMGKTDPDALNIMHNVNIFVGRKMYSLSYYEKIGKPRDEQRKKFFASLKIN
jgi:hypothetical protein